MESLIAKYLDKAGVKYIREVTSSELGLPVDFATNKRWDFAIKTTDKIYVIETNFYTSGGSKRSYKKLAEEAGKLESVIFIWITDGKGWLKAKNNLQETFNALETIYNISDMEAGILNVLFRKSEAAQ